MLSALLKASTQLSSTSSGQVEIKYEDYAFTPTSIAPQNSWCALSQAWCKTETHLVLRTTPVQSKTKTFLTRTTYYTERKQIPVDGSGQERMNRPHVCIEYSQRYFVLFTVYLFMMSHTFTLTVVCRDKPRVTTQQAIADFVNSQSGPRSSPPPEHAPLYAS